MTDPWYEIERHEGALAGIEVTLTPLSGKGFALGHPPPSNGYTFRMTAREAFGLSLDLAKAAGHDPTLDLVTRIEPPSGLAKRVADLERALYGETREP